MVSTWWLKVETKQNIIIIRFSSIREKEISNDIIMFLALPVPVDTRWNKYY